MQLRTVAITLTILLSLVPMAQAHAAPASRDFETRIMHDHNDDSVFLAGGHGFDAIALDVREGLTADGAVMVFRLLLNGGCSEAPTECPELRHVITFKGPAGDQAIEVASDDGGETFTSDKGTIVGPEGINDGTRFAVESWVPMADIGIAPGDELTDWFVEGYAGDEEADHMPQGAVPGVDDPLGAAFNTESYTVQAPDFYLDVEAIDTVEAAMGDEITVDFNVSNLLGTPQVLDFTVVGPGTVLDVPAEGVALTANFTKTFTYQATAEMSAPVQILVTSDLGGGAAVSFDVEVPMMAMEGLEVMGPDIPVGSTWSHTFLTPGTFTYHNHHAPRHEGRITIGPAGNATEHTITYDGSAFMPADLTIGAGDTVTWVNDGEVLMIMGGGEHVDHMHHDHMHDLDTDSVDQEAPGLPLLLLLAGIVLAARFRR